MINKRLNVNIYLNKTIEIEDYYIIDILLML